MTNRDGPRLENQTAAHFILEILWYPLTFLRKGETHPTPTRRVREVEVSERELDCVVARTLIKDLSARAHLAPGKFPALLPQPTGVKSQMS